MGVQEFDFQIDPKKPITQEIASAATDWDIYQGYLDQLPNPDEVLRLEAGGDIRVYDHIGRDARVSSNLGTRARAVVGKEWSMTPFSQEAIDIRIAEYVEKVMLSFPFDRSRQSILRGGTLKGYALSEIMWDYSEGDTFIRDMIYRHQRRFLFNATNEILLLTIENPMGTNVSIRDGLPLRKFQHAAFGEEVETPYGVGLGRVLYWPWWFKKNGIKFWMTFCDKFAGPTVVGEYDTGTLPEDQNKLLSAAQAVHSNSAIIHPKGMSLSLMEAARSGNISTYRELAEFMNEEMTIAILGQTATTSGTPGKLGNDQAQETVKDDLVKSDADCLCEAMNARDTGMIRWLVDYQFPGVNRYPQIWIDCGEEEDKKTLAERDKNLSGAMKDSGLRFTRSYYIRTHSLQEDDLEDVAPATPPDKPVIVPEKAPISFAEGDTVLPGEAELEALAGSFSVEDLQALVEGPLQPLFKLINEGGNLVDLMDDLVKLFPQMDTDKLQDLLARIIFVAEVWGRLQANE